MDARPTRIRRVTTLVALLLVLLVATEAAHARPAGAEAAVSTRAKLERALLDRINEARGDRGLRRLRHANELAQAARAHARTLLGHGTFSHSSPNGTSAAARIRRYYGSSRVGETLLWASPNVSARQAVGQWLGSSGHRSILLSSTFREIGLGAVHAGNAPGTFGGRPVTLLVADFGVGG